MTKPECPRPETLGKYVLGAMNPGEMQVLEEHLSNCQQCCDQAETLSPRDEVTLAFGLPGQSAGPDDELIADVIRRVAPLRSSVTETVSLQATDQATGFDNRALSDVQPADLLGPPLAADELGRLGGYRVLKILGSGGMGFVFLAEDEQLRRRVALKVMKPVEARKQGAKDRFLREARAAAAVEHDNVVAIHQVGEDRGIPFIAMPMLQGDSLKGVLEREVKLSPMRAMEICRQTAAGLFAAHQTGLIHRDIKPDNLWIESAKDRVKILDFGLVREVGNEDGLTVSGAILGTPSYMSPEQAEGASVDHRSDLFSLGAVLYHMLSGRSPFAGNSLTATLLNVARAQATPIQSLVPELDRELAALVSKLLSRDPKNRPQSADELVRKIEEIEIRLANKGASPQPQPQVKSQSQSQLPSKPRAPTVASRTVRRRKPPKTPVWLMYAVAGGAAAAIFLGITFFVQLGKHQVQITIDDPAIALKVDGQDVLIEDGETVTRLSAGPHQLSVQRAGLATMTREFTVEKNGQNVIHVAIVDGQLALGDGDSSPATPAQPTLAQPAPAKVSSPSMSSGLEDSPELRVANWLRSVKLPFMLQSKKNSNSLWEYFSDSTGPLPSEPFRIYEIFLTNPYTDKFQDAVADELAQQIVGIRDLESLRISSNFMTSAGIGKLVAIPEVSGVSQINIGGAEFDDGIFSHLAKLPNLTNLHLANVPRMTGAGIGGLSACPKLKSIGWTIALPTAASMEELSKLPKLSNLEMNSINCTEQHAVAIAKLDLRNLFLYNSNLDDSMVKQLAAISKLEYLNISDGAITDAGLMELRKLKMLKALDVRQTRVTPAGVAEFQKAFPECVITTDFGEKQ